MPHLGEGWLAGSLADLNYCWSALKNWPRGSSMGYSDPSAAAPTAFRSARARFNCQLSAKYGAHPKIIPENISYGSRFLAHQKERMNTRKISVGSVVPKT